MPQTDNIVLDHLRHIRRVVDETHDDVKAVKVRIGRLEIGIAQIHVRVAEVSVGIDHLANSIERLERKLDRVEVRCFHP